MTMNTAQRRQMVIARNAAREDALAEIKRSINVTSAEGNVMMVLANGKSELLFNAESGSRLGAMLSTTFTMMAETFASAGLTFVPFPGYTLDAEAVSAIIALI